MHTCKEAGGIEVRKPQGGMTMGVHRRGGPEAGNKTGTSDETIRGRRSRQTSLRPAVGNGLSLVRGQVGSPSQRPRLRRRRMGEGLEGPVETSQLRPGFLSLESQEASTPVGLRVVSP